MRASQSDPEGSGESLAQKDPTPLFPPKGASFLEMYGQFARIIFAYQGQSMFCEIMREMRDSREFPKAVTVGNGVMMLVYIVVSSALPRRPRAG